MSKAKMFCRSEIIGRMVFANVLEMSINKYLKYIKIFLNKTSRDPFYKIHYIDDRISNNIPRGATGIVVREKGDFLFYSHEYLKLDFELLWEPGDIKWKHSMNWIKTKNLFIHHILTNLLRLQRNFFESYDPKKMVPISLKEFLKQHQFLHLDISRLSRLVNNTWISFPNNPCVFGSNNNSKYLLRDLFWSKRKVYAGIIEHFFSSVPIYRNGIKDKEIQEILRQNYGLDLSVRTICNYRNSILIPAYNKINLSNPYNNYFSRTLPLHKKYLYTVPKKSGVYEISVTKHIKYPKFSSGIIYYGRSGNLLNRIRSYTYTCIKNPIIEQYQNFSKGSLAGYELFMRYFVTSKYVQIEKELLEIFLSQFGSLPVANKLPKRILLQ
ncbi:MAG: hypothetical protein Q7J65_09275 [Candidatus Marinimicrobia bacterium]|nr:hypothetical protein [Candidatus Neomarinimicrobiota bacterium]